ncbi:hypothetical protein G6Z96_14405 [Vibrio aestuarianus subsp. cardii]|nr:hypothetical protein [Vibrio aestuarianus subsp. cardii]
MIIFRFSSLHLQVDSVYKDENMVMACVFNPPITGAEVHDKNGVYPIVE